jgi:hypothetical protein
MHYLENGEWKETKEEIEATPGGAVARHGPHKVIFANNLNTAGAIDLQMANGKELRSSILGLNYYDASTGSNVWIALVKDCQGQIVNSNQVIYADAFDGVNADVRYTYRKSGFEQDVILRKQPPAPEKFGLNSGSTRLQVVTEFLNPPTPAKVTMAQTANRNGKAASIVTDDLDFGTMKISHGRAFSVDSASQASTNGPVHVLKQWVNVNGRDILIEEVPLSALRSMLQSLPVARSASTEPRSPLRNASNMRSLPITPPSKKINGSKMLTAKASMVTTQGVILDYNVSGYLTDFTFQGDTTYLILDDVYLYGTTTIEGGAVIKFDHWQVSCGLGQCWEGPVINFEGPVVCKTGPYNPAIFTAADDDSVGEILSSGPLSGYYGGAGRNGEAALVFGPYQCSDSSEEGDPGCSGCGSPLVELLQNVRIRYADTAIRSWSFWWYADSPAPLVVRNLQILNCNCGIYLEGGWSSGTYSYYCGGPAPTWYSLYVENALFSGVVYPFNGDYYNLTAEHVTVDSPSMLLCHGSTQ